MAQRLTLSERAQLASRYEVWRSVVQVQRWWRKVHGPSSVVDAKTIKNCHSKLMTTGSVVDSHRSGRPAKSRSKENVLIVQEMKEQDPNKSARQIARESGLSRYTVRTVLENELPSNELFSNELHSNELHSHPWRPFYYQELSAEDCDRRMEYGETMLNWHIDWPELFQNILWSEEAEFHIGGFVNRHYCHYWAQEDPPDTAEGLAVDLKVTVWCGIMSDQIVGPFLFEDTMNAEQYVNMLKYQVWPVVSSWDNFGDLLFMQDGKPQHLTQAVYDWLDEKLPGRWLGRRGPNEWPARSPDLTPCDSLWGWVKEKVYRSKPKTLDDLEESILLVMANIPQDFLKKSIDAIPDRLQKLLENGGAYIES